MKILHLDSNHDMIYEELSALGIENHIDLKSSKSEIENIISNYHGIVMRSRITIDKGFIEKAINLKFIARVGSGTENFDCEYLKTYYFYQQLRNSWDLLLLKILQ